MTRISYKDSMICQVLQDVFLVNPASKKTRVKYPALQMNSRVGYDIPLLFWDQRYNFNIRVKGLKPSMMDDGWWDISGSYAKSICGPFGYNSWSISCWCRGQTVLTIGGIGQFLGHGHPTTISGFPGMYLKQMLNNIGYMNPNFVNVYVYITIHVLSCKENDGILSVY